MDEITKEWFSSARERYVGAVRFAVVLLAVLFGIQLTTFTEYLDTQTRLRHAKAQAEEARALTDAMREVAAAADALQQTVTDNLKGLLSRLVEELKGDFAALDGKVADLRGNRAVSSEPGRNRTMQQLNAPGLQKREIVMDNDLEVKIKEAPKIADVSRHLTAWVDENIIHPRFAEAVDTWKQSETVILQKADALNETLRRLKEPLATAETNSAFAERLAQLRTSLKNFPARLAAVTFEPPADPTWWWTVQSKEATTGLLQEGALKVLQTGSAHDAAAQLAEAASQTQRDTEAARNSLQEQLTALEKSFEEQKQQADAMAKPFAFIALNLDFVARRFPVLIGCGLAIAIGWPAYRRRELVSVLRLMERLEPESGRLVRAFAFGGPQANRPPVNLRWPLAGVFAAVWVAITGSQLAAAGVLTTMEAGMQMVWGVLPIVVAVWYAYRIDRNLRSAENNLNSYG
jgi:type II secretory pathway pseudopilin PulG